MGCGCNYCGQSPCCCNPLPPASNCPPSATPPWARESQSPLLQNLTDATVPLVLDPNVAYLNQTQSPTAPITNNMAMPNGAFTGATMRIMVVSAAIAQTVTWIFGGNFAGGFTKLTFNSLGYNAFLQWDGTAWQLLSGNAILAP